MESHSNWKQVTLGIILSLVIAVLVLWAIISIVSWFSSLKSDLAIGILTASTTIFVSTITVMLGRYFERVKETEAHLRTQKIELYDEILTKLFSIFHKSNDANTNEDLVTFLQDWQRKLIVWGGPNVIKAFVAWLEHMKSAEPNAQTMFLMEKFLRAMRADIGLSNRNLEKGLFTHFILRHASLFLAEAKKKPDITLAELSRLEKERGL